jgi:hypothetical protein
MTRKRLGTTERQLRQNQIDKGVDHADEHDVVPERGEIVEALGEHDPDVGDADTADYRRRRKSSRIAPRANRDSRAEPANDRFCDSGRACPPPPRGRLYSPRMESPALTIIQSGINY